MGTFKVGKLELDYCRGDYNSAKFNERSVEVPLGQWFIDKFKNEVLEVGCVMPYYGYENHTIIDLTDVHPKNIKANGLDWDYKDKNVLCISTIEHYNKREYNNGSDEDAITQLHKIIDHASNWLITYPCTYHPLMDDYLFNHPEITRVVLKRVDWDNNWEQEKNSNNFNFLFGHRDGRSPDGIYNNCNGLVLITNQPEIIGSIVSTKFGIFRVTADGISQHLNKHEFWDGFLRPVYDKYLNKDSVVIEVGAHIGSHTIYLGKKVNKVFAFEPQPKVYEQLIGNLILNNLGNVCVFNCAVYSNCETKFSIEQNVDYETFRYSSALGLVIDKEGPINSVTLDKLDLDRLDMIKCDSQGADYHAFKGAENLIKKFKPILVFETEPTLAARFNSGNEQLFNFIKEIGYTHKNLAAQDYVAFPNT